MLLYNFFIRCYQIAVSFAALWNPKAKQWIHGRKHLFKELAKKISPSDQIIWMHCASAGEFEQGKPVIERLKQIYSHHKILISFFSPSGYAAGARYGKIDFACYLPLDTKKNAELFLKIVRPRLVIFVKYEYWYHHLKAVRDQNIPLLLISAIFRGNHIFFKSYGTFHRKILQLYTNIFVQDEVSKNLLNTINVSCIINGDTRFDRVAAIADNFNDDTSIEIGWINIFAGNGKVLIAGSTWPEDEEIIAQVIGETPDIKLMIAPHEITKVHIDNLIALFPRSIKYSHCKKMITSQNKPLENLKGIENDKKALLNLELQKASVLIIDNVGILSRLYQFAAICYIGGGFNKSGIHNTLEAAVWGKPVIIGPNYQKFKEAKELIKTGGAFSISNGNELSILMQTVLADDTKLNKIGKAAKNYVLENRGATEKIISSIQENLLLTN